ncbi:MAG: serine/threonine protein kinase [Myxococcales bacterium]|nr:serine/threonine protein kinase [Myxococcales bacterium]
MTEGRDKRVPNAVVEAATAPPNSPTGDLPQPAPLKLVTMVTSSMVDIEFETSQVTRVPSEKERSDPYIGSTIDGRYRVERILGEGGMGVVYRCIHTIIGKKVAMKVLRADLARDKEVTERFLNEARSASAIGNEHIIDISDFGLLPDGSTYFVMEFLEGDALTKIVEGGTPVPVPRLIHIAKQLAEGLAAAHRAGIVHRDLKPDNIHLIDRGGEKDFVKILDFGIAKVSSSTEGRLTRAGAVFGTPHYMAPEQAAGAPVDHRGDIYSYGVILYELASGKVPFDADNFMGILTQHMYKAPVPIRALVPEPQAVPPGLEAIVLKCLSKRPEQRYQSMEELLADLDKHRTGDIPAAVPEMMNRSGGFNVPADYFKTGAQAGMPAMMPASPLELGVVRSRWPLFAGVAGVLTAVGIVIGIFAFGSNSTAQSGTTASVEPAPPPPPSAIPTPPAKPTKKQVVLAIEPIDAEVFLGKESLGESPVVMSLDPDEKREVTIKRDGFRPRTISVDTSEPKLSVKLVRIPGARYIPPVKKKPEEKKPVTKPGGKTGGGDPAIVDPWK